MGTTFIGEIEECLISRTDSAQNPPVSRKVKFPHTISFRSLTAKIYGRSEAYPFYRVAIRVAGKRVVRSFATFAEAKKEAEAKLRQTATGNLSAGLSAKETADTIAIRQALSNYSQETDRRVSALEAVQTFIAAAKLLPDKVELLEAVRAYRQTIAAVQRKSLTEAVKEFCDARKQKTVAKDGKRPQLNAVYVADIERMLNGFAAANSAADVCDLTKQHLDLFMAAHGKLSPKSRNHFRNTLGMFLRWCIRLDYLATSNRLLESEGLRKEDADTGDVDYYRPTELRLMLDNAAPEMVVIIALQAFGGLRLQEALRLDWGDVWRIPGNVEISSAKAKTRSRRLVEINSTLAAWLEPHQGKEGKVTSLTLDAYTWQLIQLRKRLKIPSRKNGLRHGFLSAHYALHQNENQTAAISGTSPAMLFRHYKGLMTKADAEKWFQVSPSKKPDQ